MRSGSAERAGEGEPGMNEEDLGEVVSVLQGMLDAEVLLPEEVEPLLVGAEAAVRSFEAGQEETARSLLERLAMEGEALVRSGLLDQPIGHALSRTICRAMEKDAG